VGREISTCKKLAKERPESGGRLRREGANWERSRGYQKRKGRVVTEQSYIKREKERGVKTGENLLIRSTKNLLRQGGG